MWGDRGGGGKVLDFYVRFLYVGMSALPCQFDVI